MSNMKFYEASRSVPVEAQKSIGGGRLKGMTDINPMWRIKTLTEMFGPVGIGWYYKITDKRIEAFGNEASAFVDIELYIKVDGEWSMPIYGTGGSSFVTIERSGTAYMSDECFKMALTDAISIACKALGFGADIYYAKDRTKYDKVDQSKPTNLDTNELITLGFKKGYSAATIEKNLVKKYGHGMEFMKQTELDEMIAGFNTLPDKE